MQQVDDYRNKVKHLPPAPRILTELLSLQQKDDVDQALARHDHASAFEILFFDPGSLPRILEATHDRMEMLQTLFRLAE